MEPPERAEKEIKNGERAFPPAQGVKVPENRCGRLWRGGGALVRRDAPDQGRGRERAYCITDVVQRNTSTQTCLRLTQCR